MSNFAQCAKILGEDNIKLLCFNLIKFRFDINYYFNVT